MDIINIIFSSAKRATVFIRVLKLILALIFMIDAIYSKNYVLGIIAKVMILIKIEFE